MQELRKDRRAYSIVLNVKINISAKTKVIVFFVLFFKVTHFSIFSKQNNTVASYILSKYKIKCVCCTHWLCANIIGKCNFFEAVNV